MKEPIRSAREVQAGVAPPPCVNPAYRLCRRNPINAKELFERVTAGDRSALALAITLIESTSPRDEEGALTLMDLASRGDRPSLRVGWTGIPGVGKSTLINRLGVHLCEQQGTRLAVLTIDPSSASTRGSILGDKSRMAELAVSPNAFIRPSAAGDSIGGVAHKTHEAIALCEAAGYDTIFIETVGVGQTETAVHEMCDVFVLLMLSGAGDELQGMKRGIVELADVVAVTKADGENEPRAAMAAHQLRQALHLMPMTDAGWETEVQTCSALVDASLEHLWSRIEAFATFSKTSGRFAQRRSDQGVEWMEDRVMEAAVRKSLNRPELLRLRDQLEPQVRSGAISPRRAAAIIVGRMADVG